MTTDDEPPQGIREAVGRAFELRRRGDTASLVELLRSPLETRDVAIRFIALVGLEKLRATTAIPHIVPMLDDPRPDVRAGAVVALARLGARAHVGQIIDRLADEEAGVRQRAAEALGELSTGDTRAAQALARALDDESWHVRRTVLAALAKVGDHRLVGAVEERARREPLRRKPRFRRAARLLRSRSEIMGSDEV